LYCGEKKAKNWATCAIVRKTNQNKQSPNGRKFAQSGHPVFEKDERSGETEIQEKQIK
jgi:hypothetical protein